MRKTQDEKSCISAAGEYGVLSELNKRGIKCYMTIGNEKAIDIIVVKGDKNLKIEVKTHQSKNKEIHKGARFVTSFFQKYYDSKRIHPDFWILVYIDGNYTSHYYIMSHKEMGDVQAKRNGVDKWPTEKVIGCDNVLLDNIKEYENCWCKLDERLTI